MSFHDQMAISQMFDGIAETYDRTNRILSCGLDQSWRAQLLDFLPKSPGQSVLDVATGTGDILLALRNHRKDLDRVVGVDMAKKMLAIAQRKLDQRGLTDVSLVHADAGLLPFSDQTFDVVTIAFGIRNVINQDQAFLEFLRVLKPDGRLLVLEFSMPKNIIVRNLYQLYFRYLLPHLGGWLSHNKKAYRYLNTSVESFPHPEEYRLRLLSKGFSMVELRPLSCGVATIYCARKSACQPFFHQENSR
jgi:demethylmenaquinone methyltransferase / 2-methoxy-6-polyprenyl-1,4-benzoquinol methylase